MRKKAIGTHRQTLQLNDQQFEIDEVEQGALAGFLTEMRRTRYWKHETWCDPKQHATPRRLRALSWTARPASAG